MEEFDYVVVGGGSSGSIMAARLAEAGHKICLLEAGPMDKSFFINIPAGFMKLIFDPKHTWGFTTEPGPAIYDRTPPMLQGRVIGGSGSINGMVWVRGQAADFDNWAQRGNAGWSYADMLPYFKQLESKRDGGDPEYRGTQGGLNVVDLHWKNTLVQRFIDAVAATGAPRNADYNGAAQYGVGTYQYNIRGGQRVSAARAFLHPAMRRHAIDVRTHAQATGLVFEGRRATGVRYRNAGGESVTVRARREVVLCAGAINTPRLLQVSGIGPGGVLRDIGVDVVHELAGVGENLHDHYTQRFVYRVRDALSINQIARGPHLASQVAKWLLRRPSIIGIGVVLGAAFLKSRPELENPDYVMTFTPGSFKEGFLGVLDDVPGMTLGVWQLRPDSRGFVRARSTDPAVAPAIQPNWLGLESDREVMTAAMLALRNVVRQAPLAQHIVEEVLPGTKLQTGAELLEFARRNGLAGYHAVGTCRMGPEGDAGAVVDAQLRVHGIAGLRVADASVAPVVPSGNTNATAMMIGAKGADLIMGGK